MRLLHTQTLDFQEFYDNSRPPYVILSHRWDSIEVSFQDFKSANNKDGAEYEKILGCCSFADKRGFAWVWIDTCCIDKTSSAELSEAINSMYRWYERAVECYVYLSDVDSSDKFRKSEWFKRGWTLQELLAPDRVIFLDHSWNVIGDRQGMARDISTVTGIPELYLRRPDRLRDASVAMKMSWASRRKTSRVEDRAYCLLGLFGVNMPLLYGEGRKAFLRLQLEILKISDDESIFAWKGGYRHREDLGLLAIWPEEFASSGTIGRHSFSKDRPPYSMTHKGLKLHVPSNVVEGTNQIVMPLNCARGEEELPLAVVLCKHESGSWARLRCEELITAPVERIWSRRDCSYPNKATIYVRQLELY